jgi:hypothetical protein
VRFPGHQQCRLQAYQKRLRATRHRRVHDSTPHRGRRQLEPMRVTISGKMEL